MVSLKNFSSVLILILLSAVFDLSFAQSYPQNRLGLYHYFFQPPKLSEEKPPQEESPLLVEIAVPPESEARKTGLAEDFFRLDKKGAIEFVYKSFETDCKIIVGDPRGFKYQCDLDGGQSVKFNENELPLFAVFDGQNKLIYDLQGAVKLKNLLEKGIKLGSLANPRPNSYLVITSPYCRGCAAMEKKLFESCKADFLNKHVNLVVIDMTKPNNYPSDLHALAKKLMLKTGGNTFNFPLIVKPNGNLTTVGSAGREIQLSWEEMITDLKQISQKEKPKGK